MVCEFVYAFMRHGNPEDKYEEFLINSGGLDKETIDKIVEVTRTGPAFMLTDHYMQYEVAKGKFLATRLLTATSNRRDEHYVEIIDENEVIDRINRAYSNRREMIDDTMKHLEAIKCAN